MSEKEKAEARTQAFYKRHFPDGPPKFAIEAYTGRSVGSDDPVPSDWQIMWEMDKQMFRSFLPNWFKRMVGIKIDKRPY